VTPPSLTAGLTLMFPSQDLAMLRTPTWALYDGRWDWHAYLAHAFISLHRRGITNSVIDLRGNEGGFDVGNAMLPYLVDHAVMLDEPERRVRYRSVPDALRPYLDTWDGHFFDWGNDAQTHGDGFYTLAADPDAISVAGVQSKAPHFVGRVFVLIDAMNSSATFQFAQRVRELHTATLVGQPTGGNQRGINGGAFFLRLPHSGIELDAPLIAPYPSRPVPDAGVQPNFLVEWTADDVRDGRDRDMQRVNDILAAETL
jgi:hypothetical protein